MRMSMAVLAASSLVACGDDGGGGGVTPDAPMELRYPISFEVRGEMPLLLAFADDDGTWTPIVPNPQGDYMISATNRHAIVMVCGSDVVGYRTEVAQRTRFDDDPFFFCYNGGGTSQFVAVTGQMLQPGEVQMLARDEGTASPWTFELMVLADTHDLVAFGESMVLLRRNISVTAAMTLPDVDLTQGGAAYATTPVLLDNVLGDETVETVASIFTGNDIADYVRSGSTLYEVPSSLLGPTDFQFAEIRATTATTSRSASIDTMGPTPMLTLMPRLSGIEFSDHGATWSDLPDSTAEVRLFSSNASEYLTIEASGGYIAGDTELGVTLDIPGYDDAWRLTGSLYHTFVAYDDENGQTEISSGPTSARRVPPGETASRRRMDRERRVRSGAAGVAPARR
jgi:hypothetical protein